VSVRTLLSELRQHDILLETDGEKLRVDAPADAITEERRATLKKHKQDLIKLLHWERERERRKLEGAERRRLLVRWSQYPEWIKLHDPLSGE
jgi:hypothetical protein